MICVGAPLGIGAAAKPGSWVDQIATAVASFGVAVPYFWVGMVLVLLFGLKLGWFPATGLVPFSESPRDAIWSATLPAIALSMSGIAEITRQLRASLLEVLGSHFVRTLRAKGLPWRSILWRHGLKNVGITLVTVLGLVFNRKIGATVVIETVFAIPGMAARVLRDHQQGFCRGAGHHPGVALIVVSVNLIVDLMYALLDPRVEA